MIADPNSEPSRLQDQLIPNDAGAVESVANQNDARDTDPATGSPSADSLPLPAKPAEDISAKPLATTELYKRQQSIFDLLGSLIFGESSSADSLKPLASYLPDPLPPDFQMGQYRIVEKIGQGGMGTVYRAVHVRLKKHFALKVLPNTKMADPKAVARFNLEMEAVGRLDHPNVVRATDAGDFNGCHFLAMELIEGADLARVLRVKKTLAVADACELVRQAAAGLQSAYEGGLVHRDIKPSNLLLARDGSLKILDLGLARLSTPAKGDEEITAGIMGTPDYMAPEQWTAVDSADIRSDLYSLGCTLYALLTGHPPFHKSKYGSNTLKMEAHLGVTPEPVAMQRDDLPRGVVAIIDRLLAKDPANRFETPALLMAELAKHTAGADLVKLAADSMRVTTVQDGRTLTFGKSELVPAKQRRRIGRMLLIAVSMIALVLIATKLRGIYLGNSVLQEEPRGENIAKVPTPRKITPGVWHDLLDREPSKFIWPEDANNARWEYDPKAKTLFIDCMKLGMINLAEIEEDSFELEATIYQNPWSGRFGFFYFPTFADHEWRSRALQIEQVRIDNDFQRMDSTLSVLVINPENPASFGRFLGQQMSIPNPGEHRFRVRVANSLITEALLDGIPFSKTLSEPHAAYKGLNNKGTVGIYIDISSIKITSVRIRTISN